VPRLAAPTVLLACAASLLAAPSALAKPNLPPSAERAPVLPPGVVVAESPALTSDSGQRDAVASAARANPKRAGLDETRRPFWATVNVCDTKASPNALGVRASVPGNGSKQRIYARYTAQWWSSATQEWKTVGGSGVTDWIYMGSADVEDQQAGWTFRFVQPPEGATYVMRGVVEMEWRAQARAARKAGKAHKARKARRAHRLRKGRKGARRKARSAQRWNVVRERTLLTKTGMTGVEGGDPAGTSKAMCLIW
jgi:hypothetical protein